MYSIRRRDLRHMLAAVGALLVAATAPLAAQTTGTITGKVSIEGTGRPLASAMVTVVGTTIGTQTNEAGDYRLVGVPAGSRQVRVQRIGYAPVTSPVTVNAGETLTLNLQVRETPVTLEQVVTTATGEARKREIANSMATISTTEIENAPVRNTQQLLTARAPGVTVLGNSGQPGAGGQIVLRGINSISQGNNPIIYVDGIRIYSGTTPVVPNARQTINPFNDIKAEDIERVEIVRGAAATTLYGTEASGGVIQIFTKRGRSGRPEWTLEATGGTNDLKNMGPDGDPTGVFVKQCRGPELFGIELGPTSPKFGQDVRFVDPSCPANGTWLKTGVIQRYSGSVSGGVENMGYFLSGNYGDEEGAIPSSDLKDGGARGNFSFRPNSKVEFSLSSSYAKRNLQWVPDGNLANGFLLNVARGPAGNFKGGGVCSGVDTTLVCVNNAEIFKLEAYTRSDHFTTGFTVNHTPWARLVNRLTIGYDYNNSENQSIINLGHLRSPLGQILQGNWRRKFLSADYASTFRYDFSGALASSLSWGGQLFQDIQERTDVQGDEFSGPGKPTVTTAARRTVNTDIRQRVINAGFFVQEQLAWRDRLFVTGGIRVDGHSAFGADYGLQTFPKFGVSYVLSDHSFWPRDYWETMKLRAAIGESGKAPGAFDAVRTWSAIAGDEAKPGFTPDQIGNPNLGPERTRELELGFETAALNGRVGLDFTYFNTRTIDALVQVRRPPSEGFLNRQLMNVGELHNTGVEAALDVGLVRLQRVEWRGRMNYTAMKSEAVDLGGEPTISIGDRTEVREGYPVPSFFGFQILNPDAFAEPILTDVPVFRGRTFPNRIIGVGTTLRLWQRVTLDGLGEFQRGGSNINYVGYQNALRGVWHDCIPIQRKLVAAQKGDATALNDVTARDRARCAIDRTKQNSDFWIEPTDFFKLRYVTLTFELPSRLLRGARSASLTLAGRNLLTSSDYSGLDPESADQSDNTFARREYYVLPSMRAFTASLRLRF